MIDRLSILGLGLIGGSIARGARERRLARKITAWNRTPAVLEEALAARAIDLAAASPAEAVRGADLVILAVPVLAAPALGLEVRRHAPASAVITDAGSTKESIVAAMEAPSAGGAPFVGGHPIAGTENSGFAASRGNLFEGAPFILTPTARTEAAAAAKVETFWAGLGSRVYRLAPGEHDRLFALISHLPHLAAYALVGAVFSGLDDREEAARYMGGGFRDFTRIAASDPAMWRDICLDNRRHLLHALDLLESELSFIRQALSSGEAKTLEAIFAKARSRKKAACQPGT